MSNFFNKNVDEGLFNPKTVGTDMRVTQGLSPLGQEYGLGAIQAQRQALAGYQGIANGTAPSLAQMQFEQGMAQNQRAAMGLMGAQRGGNVAGAYGQALGAQQGANLAAVQQGAQLRAMEQQAAYANMGQLAGQMSQQQFGYDQLNQQSLMGLRGQDLNYNLGKRGLDMQADQNAFGNAMAVGTAGAGAVGSMLGGIGSMGAGYGDPQDTSDERAKVGLGALPMGGAGDAVASVQPMAWDSYTDPSYGQGPRPAGVSAQQLQGTPLRGLVQRGPDGMLQVDGAAAGTTALAASADQEHRIRELEARLAQQDPYASQEMRTMGQDFERAQEGPYRTSFQRRQMASNESEARRGVGLVRGATPRDPFDGAPQMERGGSDRIFAEPIMRDPGGFSSPEFTDSPSPFGPDPVERTGMQPRAMPRRRRPGLVQVTDDGQGPPRAEPVSFGNTPHSGTAQAWQESYRPGSAQVVPYQDMTGYRQAAPLDQASQTMLDGAHDYLNEWTQETRGENGLLRRRLLSPEEHDYYGAPTPVDLQRQMDQLERDDAARAMADERARRYSASPRGML